MFHCCNCLANHADYGQGVCANCKNHDIVRQRLWRCECGELYDYEEQAEDCGCSTTCEGETVLKPYWCGIIATEWRESYVRGIRHGPVA